MLAINTAFKQADLALQVGEKVILKTLDANTKHSENVLKTIDEMCQEAEISINAVEELAVVVGPGSFTGLRIGTAIAQALGCTTDVKFVALSSLELMSYIIQQNDEVKEDYVCVINALSNLFFVCEFDKNGIKLTQEKMIDKAQLDAINKPKFALLGDVVGSFNFVELDSQSLLNYANLKTAAKNYVSAEEMLPVYLRLSQAEDNLLKNSQKDDNFS